MHTLTKISHDFHSLDGKQLESKSYLPHDIMHFAYMKVTHSKEGFFADGENLMREEAIVGAFQGLMKELDAVANPENLKEDYFRKVIDRINEYLEVSNYSKIEFDKYTILEIYKEYKSLMNKWKNLKTGESLTI